MDDIVGSLNIIEEHYLSVDQLKDNYIYEVKGKNFSVAVWKEKKKKILRHKKQKGRSIY